MAHVGLSAPWETCHGDYEGWTVLHSLVEDMKASSSQAPDVLQLGFHEETHKVIYPERNAKLDRT